MNNLAIGRLVKQLRKEKKITVSEFAKKIEISQPSLSRIENGIQELSFSLLANICYELNMTMSEFFFRLERNNNLHDLEVGFYGDNVENINQELDRKLIDMLSTFSIEQKKGLFKLLFPYIKD
ncbi:helix-turn-helix domain-containing protein [Calidifontibacillus oryziterrae]|uniref:helix-turn-helix domain-containing protein n=1 Tax=Calidifontibacillus oryziterrae TaxID=1191699 RepID=UPI000365B146|nr:helix-turn-helix transcriptional regulator [Calidifontibacillus oryziterrae]